MYFESSGSIRTQIGQSLNAMRDHVNAGDALGVADHLAFMIAIASPKLSPEEMQKLELPAMQEGKDRNGSKQRELFSACMKTLAELLCILSEKGLYAYRDVPIGDATDLAITDPENPDGVESVPIQ